MLPGLLRKWQLMIKLWVVKGYLNWFQAEWEVSGDYS